MKRKPQRRVTLLDVANHAGVSRATASLIVRNSPKVADKTREKVLQSMEELGYVYDRVAANLRSQSSKTIGIIITDVGNTYFSQLLLGVHQEFEKYDYTVLLGTTFDSLKNQEKLISTMLENRVGGIILCPVSASSTETVKRVNELNLPVVSAVRELDNITCDYVGLDYVSGAKKAVEYLIHEKGHTRIAFIGGYSDSSTWYDRMEGYKLAFEEANLTIDEKTIIDGKPTKKGGETAASKVMELKETPTAIFCFNDLVAFGATIILQNMGYTIGEDIDIIGFDDIPEAEIAHPPLTTISSFALKTGEKAAKLLHNRLNKPNESQQRIVIEPKLIKRQSS